MWDATCFLLSPLNPLLVRGVRTAPMAKASQRPRILPLPGLGVPPQFGLLLGSVLLPFDEIPPRPWLPSASPWHSASATGTSRSPGSTRRPGVPTSSFPARGLSPRGMAAGRQAAPRCKSPARSPWAITKQRSPPSAPAGEHRAEVTWYKGADVTEAAAGELPGEKSGLLTSPCGLALPLFKYFYCPESRVFFSAR